MPEEFDAGTGKAKNIMDSFIEALYGQSEETIPEEYDWFAPLLGDWEFEYKDKFIDGDRSRPQRQLKGEWIFRRGYVHMSFQSDEGDFSTAGW